MTETTIDALQRKVGWTDIDVQEVDGTSTYVYGSRAHSTADAIEDANSMMFKMQHGEVEQYAVRHKDIVIVFNEDESEAVEERIQDLFSA